MTVTEVIEILRKWAPEHWAEGFDNPGLLVGWEKETVHGVYVALDPSSATVRAAIENGCDLIVTHHPMFLGGAVKNFSDAAGNPDIDAALLCARSGISLYAMHTNLDRAWGGVNDVLRETLEWEDAGVLEDGFSSGDDAMPRGLARLAKLPHPMTLDEAARHCARKLGIEAIEVVGDGDRTVSLAALCGGSGGSLLAEAAASGADLFLTGEMKHHERLLAEERGIALLVAGHAETEQMIVPAIAAALQNAFSVVQCKIPVISQVKNAPTRRVLR